MNIIIEDISLTEETYAYIYRKSAKENAERFKKEVKRYIENINDIVNLDFKKLSDKEFYKLISKIYAVSLEKEDCFKILSKLNNKEYKEFVEIGAYMTFTDTVTEGRGRSFDYWKQLYQVRYIVAVCKEIDILYNATFAKKDIKKMLDNKSIVIVKEKYVPLDTKPDFKEESIENFVVKSFDFEFNTKEEGLVSKNENFPIIISMLRRRLNKKKILKDMKEYIEELKMQIDEILLEPYQDPDYIETSKLCNEWFENSEEKVKYDELFKILNKEK